MLSSVRCDQRPVIAALARNPGSWVVGAPRGLSVASMTVGPNDSYHRGSTLDVGADGAGAAGMKAEIAQVLSFGSALLNDDVDEVFTCFGSKWGITAP